MDIWRIASRKSWAIREIKGGSWGQLSWPTLPIEATLSTLTLEQNVSKQLIILIIFSRSLFGVDYESEIWLAVLGRFSEIWGLLGLIAMIKIVYFANKKCNYVGLHWFDIDLPVLAWYRMYIFWFDIVLPILVQCHLSITNQHRADWNLVMLHGLYCFFQKLNDVDIKYRYHDYKTVK